VRKDVSGRKDIPTVPEIIQDCGPLTEVAMSILDDTITTETSAQEDLQGEKSRLENMNKTSSDYGQQFDDYVQSLKAMQDRLKTTEDDVNTMRGELVEMKCSVAKIDEKLQEMGELQIWVDIESDMGLQFLRPINVHLMNTP
jgi:DNA repair ATPase RecN